MTFRDYCERLGMAVSRLLNVVAGGEVDQSLSARVGQSRLMDLPMPGWLRKHFEDATRWWKQGW
jgi:hypothetical protein